MCEINDNWYLYLKVNVNFSCRKYTVRISYFSKKNDCRFTGNDIFCIIKKLIVEEDISDVEVEENIEKSNNVDHHIPPTIYLVANLKETFFEYKL